jgi:hypothetical protein
MSKATSAWTGVGVGVALTLLCASPSCPANDPVNRGLSLVLNCGMGVTDVGTVSEKPLSCPACRSLASATLTKQAKARECVLVVLGSTAAADIGRAPCGGRLPPTLQGGGRPMVKRRDKRHHEHCDLESFAAGCSAEILRCFGSDVCRGRPEACLKGLYDAYRMYA